MSKPTSPLKAVIIYAICAVIWALSIDLLITLLTGHVNPELLTWLLHYKGILFALLSSILLYGLLKANRYKLETSEKAYIRMFRENPQPMWIYSKRDFRFLEVNDAAVQLYGYTREEFLQMDILDIRPEEDINKIRENQLRATSLGYNPSGIWRHYKKDGSLMFVRVESFVITYEGEAAEVVSIFDVTAAYLADEALKKALERYDIVTMATNDAIWDFDLLTNKVTWNDNALYFFGFSNREEHVDFWASRIHPDDSSRVMDSVYQAAREGQNHWREEYRLLDLKGHYRHVISRGYIIYNEKKEPVRMIGALQDIEEMIVKNEEIRRLSLVASMTHNPVIITDSHAHIEWVNKSFEDLTGYALEEVKGLQPHAFLHGPDTDPAIANEIREKLEDSRPCVVEILNYTSTGEPYWVMMDITPIVDPSGQVERHIIIQTNITEKKKIVEQLEEKNRLLMDVAFISSHRLRMPVASMLGLFAQMDMENLANPENLPFLRYIEKLVNDMDDMLHEMAEKCNQIYSKSTSENGV